MQKQFRYFWLSFNPFSNSSIVGIDDLKSFGKSLESWYSDIPIGSLYDSKAYLATTLSLSLQISKPMVGLSISVFEIVRSLRTIFTLCYNSLNICNIQVLYKIVRNGV